MYNLITGKIHIDKTERKWKHDQMEEQAYNIREYS